MISVEDKIKTFSKYVYKKELSNSYQLINNVERKNNEIINKKQKEIEENSLKLKNKMNKKINNDSQKIISKARLQAKEKVLHLKKELLKDFTQEITNSLISFTETNDYNEYFYKLLNDSNQYFSLDESIKIYLVNKDIDRFQNEIQYRYKNAEILEMNKDYIGGFIIEFSTVKKRIDFSIKRKIADWNNEIGIALYEALEK